MPRSLSIPWTREHRLIALNVYTKLPFGKLHHRNPLIMQVAEKMGRSVNSLALKLVNFASLDPVLHARGIKGMSGASEGDRQLWVEFFANMAVLGPLSEELLHDLFTPDPDREVELKPETGRLREESRLWLAPTGPTETLANVKVRRGQSFFREAILGSYESRCCISGINVPDLLVASHIKPWTAFPNERLNLRNGLCLSRIHDAAFDKGLITLDSNLRVKVSKQLRAFYPQPALEQNFESYEGQTIRLPEKLAEPAEEYLTYHRQEIFQG